MTIGEAVRLRILALCAERDITVNKLATICGITQSSLSNIVSGRNRGATVTTLKKICDGLEITIIDFFNAELFLQLEQELR
ncbi:MAG: helix-turn-helix transcriptional regulator [Oscillospiraceae bacterium]|nr:helix-turn-helix transcriptional regulator [Oscillospiraceae bacterium]